jgi:hypothetical protein
VCAVRMTSRCRYQANAYFPPPRPRVIVRSLATQTDARAASDADVATTDAASADASRASNSGPTDSAGWLRMMHATDDAAAVDAASGTSRDVFVSLVDGFITIHSASRARQARRAFLACVGVRSGDDSDVHASTSDSGADEGSDASAQRRRERERRAVRAARRREDNALACVQLLDDVVVTPLLPPALTAVPSPNAVVLDVDAIGLEVRAPRSCVALAADAVDAVQLGGGDVVCLRFRCRSVAAARQWTLALMRAHRLFALPPTRSTRSRAHASPPRSSPTWASAAPSGSSASVAAAAAGGGGVVLPRHVAHGGWLVKNGRQRYCRLVGERVLWYDDDPRQAASEERGFALVALCSIVPLGTRSFVLEHGAQVRIVCCTARTHAARVQWRAVLEAASTDEASAWIAALAGVVRCGSFAQR